MLFQAVTELQGPSKCAFKLKSHYIGASRSLVECRDVVHLALGHVTSGATSGAP